MRFTRRHDEPHRVLGHRVMDEHVVGRPLERRDVLEGEHLSARGGAALIRCRMVGSSASLGCGTSTLSRKRSRWASGGW